MPYFSLQASAAIVVFMLTPVARLVISRIRRLNRSSAFGAMTRLASGPTDSKAEPEKLPLRGCATALFFTPLWQALIRSAAWKRLSHLPRIMSICICMLSSISPTTSSTAPSAGSNFASKKANISKASTEFFASAISGTKTSKSRI